MAKSSKRKRSAKAKTAAPAPATLPAQAASRTTAVAAESAGSWWKPYLLALPIIAAGLWVYGPTLHGGWLWDDDLLIFHNPLIDRPDRLAKAWFEPGSFFDYYPLQQSVQWFEWQLWHLNTFGYHVVTVTLHLVSALLMWGVLARFGLRLAWLGGLIFAVHPALVESVAWLSELKNTLSLPPFLLAIGLFLDFERTRRRRTYWLSVALFLIAMWCKTTMTTFPVILLLHAWWKRGRIRWSDVVTAAPFFVVSLVLGLVSLWLQEFHAVGPDYIPIGGFFSRLALTGLSISFYFVQCVVPVRLMPIYPQWIVDPPTPEQFLPWPVFAFVAWIVWEKRKTWGRHVALGLGFFLVLLVPFVGFALGSYMAFSWVMDHFIYVPILGLIGLFVAGLERLLALLPKKSTAGVLALVALLLAAAAIEAHSYARAWRDEEHLWSYEMRKNPGAWVAYNDLAAVLHDRRDFAGAAALYRRAIELNPRFLRAMNNLGVTLLEMGRTDEAVAVYKQGLALEPDDLVQTCLVGDALAHANRDAESEAVFIHCTQLYPTYPATYYALGNLYMKEGKVPQAIGMFREAVELEPDYFDARNDLGIALGQSGDLNGATEELRKAVQTNPRVAHGHYNLAFALRQSGHNAEAIAELQAALRCDPKYKPAAALLKQMQAPAR